MAVVGLGGLGGYIAEELARLGVGKLILVDNDLVCESNLNRQLFATTASLGLSKATAAKQRLKEVNDTTEVCAFEKRLDKDSGSLLIKGADIVFDATDNILARYALAQVCHECNLPLVHGAVGGYRGQVAVLRPEDNPIQAIYKLYPSTKTAPPRGTPSFMPAIVASIQVAEGIKLLLDPKSALCGRLLMMDLLSHSYKVVEIN